MNTEQIEALKALAEAATPGPWSANFCNITSQNGQMKIYDEGGHSEADAAYIAAANPVAIIELLASATASEGRIAELAAQVAALRSAGAKLANIAFNLKQPSQSLDDRARQCMADCQAEWDEASRALAGSATPSTQGESK